jgi:hypothetical protein
MATGATTALNTERQATILNAIRQGATEKRAASFGGVHLDTIRQWRRKGDLALAKKAGQRTPTERKYADFVTALDKALSETAVMMQSVVTGIASLGLRQEGQAPPSIEQQRVSGQMATWWLSHRERDDYTTRAEITGRDGESVGLSSAEALAMFREIAKANPLPIDDDE